MLKQKEHFNWHPGTLLEMSGYYWKTCTLHAGVKLGVFTAIGDGALGAEAIAAELKVKENGLSRLLNALCALQLLKKKEDLYSNTEAAATFLCKDSPRYIGFMIMHHYHLVDSWHRMDQAILSGEPVRCGSTDDAERRESFLMGMFNIGMAVAPGLSKELDLSGCTRLLDMGGGPGTFAIHFCLENPRLTATVYDLPTTQPFARKTIHRFKVADRVTFVPGDYEKEEFPEPGAYDAAWLSHILHGESPEMARDVVRKAVSALKPGGKIFIHEFILNDTLDGPLFPALFSINMLLGTHGGQAYSQAQLIRMLQDNGITDIVRHPFVGPTESGIIHGRVRG